ncbi:hypothetical protein RA276_28235, partial [Pseudomonas syringae pv. tagetis]|uniref:hypothetical protein n=1 Tax=Pseudomonas syringae group genomosp. 7 TaxID=251699 RepID=UPI00376FDD40
GVCFVLCGFVFGVGGVVGFVLCFVWFWFGWGGCLWFVLGWSCCCGLALCGGFCWLVCVCCWCVVLGVCLGVVRVG